MKERNKERNDFPCNHKIGNAHSIQGTPGVSSKSVERNAWREVGF